MLTMPLPQDAKAPPPIPTLPARAGQSTGGDAVAPAPTVTGGQSGGGQPADAPVAIGDGNSAGRGDLPFDPQTIIPPQVVPLTAMSLAMLVVIFIGWPLARAFGRRMDRKAELGTVRAADLQPQITQLQQSLDAMAIEIERLGEAQRFQAKLLAERAESKRG